MMATKRLEQLFNTVIDKLSLDDYEDEEEILRMIRDLPTSQLIDLLRLRTSDDKQDTILHRAARKSYSVFLKELLGILPSAAKLDLLSCRNKLDATVLFVSALYGSETAFFTLLTSLDVTDVKSLFNMTNKQGFNPLHGIAQSNSYVLLEHVRRKVGAAEFRQLLLSPAYHQGTALHMAAYNHQENGLIGKMVHTLGLPTEDILKAMKTNVCVSYLGSSYSFPFLNWIYIQSKIAQGGDKHPDVSCVFQHLSSLPQTYFNDVEAVITAGQGDMGTLLYIAAGYDDHRTVRDLLRYALPEIRHKLLHPQDSAGLKPSSLPNLSHEMKHFLCWAGDVGPDEYLLISKPVLLVICCLENRPGGQEERDSLLQLEDLFTIQTLQDPTEQEVVDKLHQIVALPNLSALCVVVMTHGKEGHLKLRGDSMMMIRDLMLQMSPQCLVHIPKVLVVQACQGRGSPAEGGGIILRKDASPGGPPSGENLQLCEMQPQDSSSPDIPVDDFVALMATVHGGDAERNSFIPILAKHMRNASKTDSIDVIFRRTKSDLKKELRGQIPILKSTLSKTLCLKNVYKYRRPDRGFCTIM